MAKRVQKTAKRPTATRRKVATPKPKSSKPKASTPRSSASKASKPKSGNSKSGMARLETELRIASDRQIATSEILRVISQSPADTSLYSKPSSLPAVRLLRCDMSFVMLCDPPVYWVAAAATPECLYDELTLMKHAIDPSANFPRHRRGVPAGDHPRLPQPDFRTVSMPRPSARRIMAKPISNRCCRPPPRISACRRRRTA